MEGEVVARGTVEKVIERSAACVMRVNVSGDGDAALRADLPGLAFVRRGARHHDLVFRGEAPVSAMTWLKAQNMSPQAVESTLADAMSIFVNTAIGGPIMLSLSSGVRRSLTLAWLESLTIRRDPIILAMILLIPTLQIALFGYALRPFGGEYPSRSLGGRRPGHARAVQGQRRLQDRSRRT